MSEPVPQANPRWFDAVTIGAFMLGYAVALVDASSWAWAPLLIPMAAQALRLGWTRFPAWAALAVTTTVVVVLNLELHAEGSFFLVCMAAFVCGADRARWVPDRLVLAASVLSPIIDAASGSDAVRDWNWPFWSMGVAVSWGFGEVLFQQKQLTASLREAQAQLAQQAVGEERRRIARDVHDLVGHSLTVVLLHLTGARRLVRRDPDEAERALEQAESAGRDSLREIRRTIALLRDDDDGLQPIPAARDLAALIEASKAAGLCVQAELDPDVGALDDTTGLVVFRIVQESLANIARHAAGSSALLEVTVDAGTVRVEIANDGGGISLAEPGIGGTGVLGMQERASALGGTVIAGPDGRGWKVTAMLPRSTRQPEVAT